VDRKPASSEPPARRHPAVRRRRSRAFIALLLAIGGSAAAAGTGRPADAAAPTALVVDVDGAQVVELREPAATVFVANPEIADVQVPAAPNAGKLVVFGKKAGFTTLFAFARSGRVSSYAVTVRRPTPEIAAALQEAVPSAHIEVSSTPNGLTVSGAVASPRDAERLKAAVKQFLGAKDTLTFNVSVRAATQVNLRVRVAEITRSADKEFNFNWSAISNTGSMAVGLLTGRSPVTTATNAATGAVTPNFGNFSPSPNNYDSLGVDYQNRSGSVNVSNLIDALATEGLITVLAEPNLTAISGESASFLAGGEFPVPVPQGLQQITIEWKKYGVSVDFTPVVLDGNRLSIKVAPEVSELTTVGSVVISGTTVPGLAIAGLFQNNSTNQIQRFPWLGDIPVLGALFRSSSFQHQESELVIIVTPYIVQPAAQAGELHLPTDGVVLAGDFERVVLGRFTARSPRTPEFVTPPPAAPHLQGDAGFMLER
jgi:pilus assembly protein CpaC